VSFDQAGMADYTCNIAGRTVGSRRPPTFRHV
jgi:hypothetical protein